MSELDRDAARDGIAGEAVALLEADGRYRVLRRLEVPTGHTGREQTTDRSFVGAAVDVETTGVSQEHDVVIEMAIRLFGFDEAGTMLWIDRPWSWREDPGARLSPEIVELTGLTDADLAGMRIDEERATSLLQSVDVVVAHNASFDRGFVERRLPGAAGLPWACSCSEVDWTAAGYERRFLGWLLFSAGLFFGAHRAASDVDAVIALLMTDVAEGRTALAELFDTAMTETVRIDATGASFDVKDGLKARGYRWDGNVRVWRREVAWHLEEAEREWLDANVYAPCHRPRSPGPDVTKVTWRERHR